jgi:hypothetical protein
MDAMEHGGGAFAGAGRPSARKPVVRTSYHRQQPVSQLRGCVSALISSNSPQMHSAQRQLRVAVADICDVIRR